MAKKKSRDNAIEAARKVLTDLRTTKEDGFEGLLSELLSAHLKVSLRLCSSGRQYGRDMGAGEIAAEAKRYDATNLRLRELAGEIGIAKRHSPELALWILGTTRSLSLQDHGELEAAAAQAQVELAVIDWSPDSCPRLLVLMACHEAIASRWFETRAPGDWSRILRAVNDVRLQKESFERVCQELELVAAGLSLAGKFSQTLIRAVKVAVSDETARTSRALFGQRVDLEVSSSGAIERPELYDRLNKTLTRAHEEGAAVVAIVGPEGVGKTWLVVDYAMRCWPDRPLLFFSSLLIEEAERGDWSHEKLVREAARRAISNVEDCDPRFRDEAFLDRLLGMLRRAKSTVLNPIMVLDGFNERRAGRWSSMVSSLPAVIAGNGSHDLIVTSRPMSWPRLSRALTNQGIRHVEIEVGGFSESEFAAACARRDIDASAFDPVTARDLRNPRLFRIAANLLDELAGAPVTRERVFWEYWRHRQQEGASGDIEPEDFAGLLKAHARGVWSGLELLKGEKTLYFDVEASQQAARFVGVENALRDVQDVLSTSFFQVGARDDSGEYRFAPDRQSYIVGLSLQRRLVEATDEALNPESVRSAVEDQLSADIDPISDTDAAGVIVATALLASCLQKKRNRVVSLACLVYLLTLRNARNHEVALTVRGMTLVGACADPAVFVAAVEELDERDPWLVEALRTALAVSDERDVVSTAIHRWLLEDANEIASTALHVLAGHDLVPYSHALSERQDPDGETGLAFWLVFLDEASRLPLPLPDMAEENSEVPEDEDAGYQEPADDVGKIEEMLRADFSRALAADIDTASGSDDTQEGSAWPHWSDDYDPGYVPVLPSSMGHGWNELDRYLPLMLSRRWSLNRSEMFFFHLQLLENRLARLPVGSRSALLRTVISACPPPPSPPNYELEHPRWLPTDEIDQLVAGVLDYEDRLLRAIGWLNYFSYTGRGFSEQTAERLIHILVDRDRNPGLRADIALFLGRSGDLMLARLLAATDWTPDTEPNSTVSLQAAIMFVPLCREEGRYPALRSRMVATMFCDVVEQVHASDLPAVLADFDAHIASCLNDICCNGYPTDRTGVGRHLPQSNRDVPLATLEMTLPAILRIAAVDAPMVAKWFFQLMGLRSVFSGDLSITEFLFDLLVGIGSGDVETAAEALERVLDHLVDIGSEADDAVLVPGRLVRAAFALPCEGRARLAVGRLVRAANQDATLCEIAHAAHGPWRVWLDAFCRAERASGRPSRVALGRTLQALADFSASELPDSFAPLYVERYARMLQNERQTAEAAITAWRDAGPAERTELESTFFDAAAGQVLSIPDLASSGDEEGALFLARIAAHQKQRIDSRGNTLFGLSGPPTRFVASNCPSRVFSAAANRRRRFAESPQ